MWGLLLKTGANENGGNLFLKPLPSGTKAQMGGFGAAAARLYGNRIPIPINNHMRPMGVPGGPEASENGDPANACEGQNFPLSASPPKYVANGPSN